MIRERLTADHLHRIEVQDLQFGPDNDDYLRLASRDAVALVKDGAVMACTGKYYVKNGDAILWAMISKHANRCLLPLHREAWRQIMSHRGKLYSEAEFPQAVRWLRMLGFNQHERPNTFWRYC